jgi:hypothetical protein
MCRSIAWPLIAVVLPLLPWATQAAEPVRSIAIYVEPFYNSGRAPG